ncbi:unnamed protein product [Sphagnum troendelagicum]|uniref:Uncharacterized protein n=1 Tax=Sphagnum troendelagicum TaxID=128251 RepID=A0ABP0UR37_9BRYO
MYGSTAITNNEFMMWLVKGYITELKGHLENWAIAIASTTREKAHRQEVKGLKSRSIDIFDFNYGELVGRVEGDGVCVTHTMKKKVKLNNKFISLWLNMDDRKVVMIKAHDDMVLIESDIRAIEQRMKSLEEKLQELQLLVNKLEFLQGELAIARSVLEQQRKQAVLGDETFENLSSWGFKEADEGMADLAAKLDLDAQWKSMKQSLKDAM